MSSADISGVDLKQVSIGPVSVKISTDWDLVTLEDVSKNSGEYGANASAEPFDPNEFRYIRITDLTEDGQLKDDDKQSIPIDGNEKYHLENGDLLFARTGAVGRTYLYSESDSEVPCAFAGYLIRFKLSDDIDHHYLRHYTNSEYFKKWVSSVARSTTHANINASEYSSVDIPYPPLPEQRRIADILSTVDKQIQQTDEIVTEYKDLRRGIVQDLYNENHRNPKSTPSGRSIDPILEKRKEVWLEAEKEKKKRARGEIDVDQSKYDPPLDLLFSSRLPSLPKGWRWVSLDTVVAYDIDYRGKTPPYSDSGVPVISSGNIQEGEITFSEERFVSPKTYDEWLTRGIPREGDLIVTTEAPVGKVAIYPDGKYLPTRRIIVFRTVGVDNRYLQAALNHPKVQSYLLAQSGGSTVGRILKDNLLRTPIPLPPEEEEERLATALISLDQKIADEQETKHRLQELKRGLMQDLLTGKVRVNTD